MPFCIESILLIFLHDFWKLTDFIPNLIRAQDAQFWGIRCCYINELINLHLGPL